MSGTKRPSRASVIRLELYLEALEQLEREGREFATSAELGALTGVSPVKVRQDLFGLASDGRPKVGYEIAHLIPLIRGVFDLDRVKPACLVGFGNLGRALAGSNIWAKAGYKLVAVFDNDPTIIGTAVDGMKVRGVSELFGVMRTEGVEMAVITVPAAQAQQVADLVVSAGARAIWNFAPVKLTTSEGVVVENQSLAWGLITLSHRTKWG